MKHIFPAIIFFLSPALLFAQKNKQAFVSQDIGHFWMAYDKIIATADTAEQYKLLTDLYLDKATPGLQSLLQVRNYTAQEFLRYINSCPKFWSSIRSNTVQVKQRFPEIEKDIRKLRKAFPDLTPATIYFSIGAFRAGGTTQGDRVLIGSELSLADQSTVVDELPEWRQPFYKTQNPIDELALLCTHEYIHTQQKPLVYNLLSMCLYEGVAEFVSCHVTGKPSNTPAIEFGKANRQKVIDQFVIDLYLVSNDYNWLWGENRNELQMRDLGYYIGYEICERYYQLAKDKRAAIKTLIELDYENEAEVERIVDAANVLPKSVGELYADYEKKRPYVIALSPFANGSERVNPGPTKITITFSEPLVKFNTGIDYGPLGSEYFPLIQPERVFSEDGTTWTFEAELKPNQQYQVLISNNFRKANGVRLKPYLIEFKTTE